MTQFKQNIVSTRFLEVLEELISKQIVASVAEFCKRTGFQAQSMSQIKAGKRDITIELISKLFSEFRGNPIYIFTGRGSKILNEQALSIVEEESYSYGTGNDKQTIKALEELVASKNENIGLLKKEITRLEKELKQVR